MKLNADFNQRVLIDSSALEWVASPMHGVTRKPLDRIGEEVARATSIVKYESGSQFSPHVHTGGEEFIVLSGVFQDEHGDYPEGTYVRNPPGSSHTPSSKPGCVIFVKLWQFQAADRQHICLDTNALRATTLGDRANVKQISLYEDQYESVCIEIWPAHTKLNLDAEQGLELLVLDGEFIQEQDRMSKHSWLRAPHGSKLSAQTGNDSVRVWIKRGHLHNADVQYEDLVALLAT